jgi:putative ABC transport system permease protein
MTDTLQDLRYAIRLLRQSPAYTVVVLATMALGIGVNAVMFAIVDAVLLRPLPYRDAERLVSLTMADPLRGLVGLNTAYTRLTFLREAGRSFESIGAYWPSSVALRTGGEPEQVPSATVTGNFFDVLGVTLPVGRAFLPDEDRPGGANVAVLSQAFWQSHFGGRSGSVGETIEVDGRSLTVVGILPPAFHFPLTQPEPQIWLPRVFENPLFSPERVRTGAAYLNTIARLRSGESVAHARAELDALGAAYAKAAPGLADVSYALQVTPLRESVVGSLRMPLIVIFAGAAFVLLIGSVNLTSLMLARSLSRQREIAVRHALGASRGRLLRQLLTESVLLSLAGGALAMLLASWAPDALRLLPSGTLPRVEEVTLDWGVVVFALGLCAATAIAFGFAPLRHASVESVHVVLAEGTRGSTGGRRADRARATLVVVEIAVTLVLISSAGLLMKSLGRLTGVDPGFESRNVVTFSLALPQARYPQVDQQARFYRRLVEALQASPLVESAATTSYLPIAGGTRLVYLCPQGRLCEGIGKDPVAAIRHVTPAYFTTMHIALVRGRVFDEHDTSSSRSVCVINEKAAVDYFGGEDPLGRVIVQSRDHTASLVVGVVRDVKALGLSGQMIAEFYVPPEQSRLPVPNMAVVVRSRGPLPPLITSARAAVAALDPSLALSQISSMDDVIGASVAQPRLTTTLTGAFATLALMLAVVGLYGMMAYAVTQRRREIAIRVALGAQPSDILRLVFGQGTRLIVAGIALGLIASLAFSQLLATLLFQMSPRDPLTFAVVTLLLGGVSLAACYVPTRRAMRVDPVAGMRAD